ncbi:MAG: hypothetical protein A3D93_06825 [Acidobacteria bacterium RIFCSPHIGHO2_12_FULL_67_30]|nr:MAG: hypothetical protein A3B65_02310 [Acidobacteria bacterium RIFCSPHIGHO2_02_FULL_67_57]OFV85302.1 MAG: hypothetical protein A2620_07050 [Acidobacteria bacterium RIFCSPHIGHO2_01_FULL_67_28]OFV86895.1 MAG: hypothetical protein A3D93_06825 [Acidobacteria bacterium RIFCSPHIGHO2_12_FULL_67_30]
MNETSQETSGGASTGSGSPRWLVAVLAVLALLLGWVAYAQYSARAELTARLDEATDKLARLESRAATLEDNYANLKAQSDVTSDKLGLTQQELSRARSLATQIKEEQRRADEQLASQVAQQQNQLGSLSGEVGAVKGDTVEIKQALEQTQMQLQRTIGDLGVQSGLIAKNSDELNELKRRGERDYFDFDVKKTKQFSRVGPVSVLLNKTDTKRQKYTMTLLANDKRIEKKDKTLLEPVQFYLQGTRHMVEIVVFQVEKDRIVGYISVPKEVALNR